MMPLAIAETLFEYSKSTSLRIGSYQICMDDPAPQIAASSSK